MKTRCSATIDQQAGYLSKTTVGSVGALLLELGMEIVHFSFGVRWLELYFKSVVRCHNQLEALAATAAHLTHQWLARQESFDRSDDGNRCK